jgi:NADH-quinone oxidoreductase subunit C
MTPESVATTLLQRLGSGVIAVSTDCLHPMIDVSPLALPAAARLLRDDAELGFQVLRCISGIDHLQDDVISLVYDLHALSGPQQPDGFWRERCAIAIRVRLPRDNPRVASVSEVWPAANWHEREAFDLLGVIFEGHPDLRRILCCDDWVGHPLRRDYEFPLEYHGVPAVTELGMTRPVQ